MLTTQLYQFTNLDEEAIEHIGYTIRGNGRIAFTDFVTSRFANFNLLKLLELVEKQCAPLTKLHIDRTIDFDEQQNTLEVLFTNDHRGDESIAVVFNRRFRHSHII